MNIRQRAGFWPSSLAVASVIAMAVLASVTSPIDNISYGLIFFGLLAVFFVAIGYLLTNFRWGEVSPKSRYRIFIVSFLLVVGLMLRSAGSLNFIEALVLALIGIGLWFYSGRRSV